MTVTTKERSTSSTTSARAQRRQLRARRSRNRRILYGSLVAAVAVGLLALILWAILKPQPGEYFASQGNAHITEAQMGQFTYNTTPPTSGPHLGSLARWGVHDDPIPNELQVHNLEDGGVMVQYDCADGCPDLVAQLGELVEHYDEGVILAPYPGMGTRIALTAWQRMDRFDEFDAERIERFIHAYRGGDHHQ
jgi:hypothetical protein